MKKNNNNKYTKPSRRTVRISLQQVTEALTRKDLQTWRRAWQYAINKECPNRIPLLNVYTDTDADTHLTGCVQQRMGFVLNKSFLVGKDGTKDEDMTAIFERRWFKDFMRYCLESIYWGHSLIELGTPVMTDRGMSFDGVSLVPRRHVIPEYGVIVIHEGDIWQSGISYREGSLRRWCVEAGKPDDLGLYLKCAQHTIPKKYMCINWDTFGEIFGIPMRTATTTSRDPKDIDRIEDMLKSMGTAAYGIFPEGTTLDIKESTRTDTYNIYDKRIERCNSEISKAILTQTMTMDDGSSLSQSEVHQEMLQNLIGQDADFIKDIVNDELIPRMIEIGFPLQGYSFTWDETVEYTTEQQMRLEQYLDGRFGIPQEYYERKYGIPLEKKKKQQNPDNGKLSLTESPDTIALAAGEENGNTELPLPATESAALDAAFTMLMVWLYSLNRIDPATLLDQKEVADFIAQHARILDAAIDYGVTDTGLDDVSIQRLKQSGYIFSGMKTFEELNVAFPALFDENGVRKGFEQFLADVQHINEEYNKNYLRTEYNFAYSAAMMAARWKAFEKDGDDYMLQYRTINDKRVRPTHRELHNITLPLSSPFWDKFFPPNGWGCRCTVVQVRKEKYKESDLEEAMKLGYKATEGKYREMFDFNPGKTMTCFPKYNSYSQKACSNCTGEGSKGDLCILCKELQKQKR